MTKNRLNDEYKSLTTAQLQDIIKLIHENLELKTRRDGNILYITISLFGNEIDTASTTLD